MKKIKITTEYITLGQFLKLTDIISSGGQEKFFVANNKILVNGENENRRGKKLKDKDIVVVLDEEYQVIKNDS